MSMWREFRIGIGVLAYGFQALFEVPKIKRTLAIPILLSFCFFWIGIVFGVPQISQLVTAALVWLAIVNAGWMAVVYWLLAGFLWVGFLLVGLILVYVVTLVVMAPIYAILAEKTLKHYKEPLPQVEGLQTWLVFQFRLLRISLFKASIFLIFSVFLFVFSFLPGLGFLCGYFGFILISCDLLDYSLEAKGLSFAERVRFLRSQKFVLMGMAAMLSLTVLVPGLTFFLLPIGVIGAARIFPELNKNSLKKNSNQFQVQIEK